jgi:hypothetical protein
MRLWLGWFDLVWVLDLMMPAKPQDWCLAAWGSLVDGGGWIDRVKDVSCQHIQRELGFSCVMMSTSSSRVHSGCVPEDWCFATLVARCWLLRLGYICFSCFSIIWLCAFLMSRLDFIILLLQRLSIICIINILPFIEKWTINVAISRECFYLQICRSKYWFCSTRPTSQSVNPFRVACI